MTNEVHGSPVLPRGWMWTHLSDISDIVLGQSPPSSTYNVDGRGLPFYQGKLEFGKIYPNPQKWCTAPKKIAEKGDILVSVRAPVGPTNICPEKSCIGRGLAAIRGLGGIEPLFILYLMRTFETVIAEKGTGTTFKAITGDRLRDMEIPLPPLGEQRRIVAKVEELFAKLDAGVEGLERVKAQLKHYRQAVLKYAFEGKLTEEWRKTHRDQIDPSSMFLEYIKKEGMGLKGRYELPPIDSSEISAVPDSWVWTRIGQICEMLQYGTSEKAGKDPTGIPVLRMGNIQDGRLVFDDLKYLSENWPPVTDYILEDGDVLFNRTNSPELVGKTAVYEKTYPKAVFASYLIRIKTNKSAYIPDLLSFYINSFFGRQYIKSVVSQQVGQANVNGTKLSLMPIPLIPLIEQEKIVEEIETRISMAAQVEKTVERVSRQAERFRQIILKRAFEGELVHQDASEEPAEKLLERIREERSKSKIGENVKKMDEKKRLREQVGLMHFVK